MKKVVNIHQRELQATAEQAGALIDTLASDNDLLWPVHSWPPMRFDRPLAVGADGGHGPIGYCVEQYTPGRFLQCRFTRPKGYVGHHKFEIVGEQPGSVVLRHTIEMTLSGFSQLTWSLAIRPMHDALIEDCLATAQASLGIEPQMIKWSLWIKILRWIMSGGKVPRQLTPAKKHV